MESAAFLRDLAVVLCVAAVTSVLFQRLRLPAVPGYIVAGVLVGPHVPTPLVADAQTIQTLAQLGVVLLMFSIGLEFSLRRLARLGPRISLVVLLEVGLLLAAGSVVGQLFGWSPTVSVLAGAIVAISSTMIAANVFAELKVEGPLRELVLSIMVVEDLAAILLITGVTTLTTGNQPTGMDLARTAGRLLAFLAGALALGLLVVPPSMRAVARLRREETTLVASVGLCFAAALLALAAGYSMALGAFLAGSLVYESGAGRVVEQLVRPLRDMFAAIFFVAVGMLLDPKIALAHWAVIAVLVAVLILGKTLGVGAGAFLTGHGTRLSLRAGMSAAQTGEFAFIIAGVGAGLGGDAATLPHVAAAVSVITAFASPWLVRASEPLALALDRRLPRSLQTFVTLYGSWVELVREAPQRSTPWTPVRRAGRLVLLDAVLVAGMIIGASVNLPRLLVALGDQGVPPGPGRWIILGTAAACAAPFAVGMVRSSRRLGNALADLALPARSAGAVDPADAPRRAFVVTLQIAIVMMVGVPLLAVTQPFLPRYQGVVAVLAALLILGFVFWRTATNLQGHMRAGAEMVAEALGPRHRGSEAAMLLHVQHLLPGLGTLVPVRVAAGSAAAGVTLADLNLRGRTGATAVALSRGGEDTMVFPTAKTQLRAGDMLALSGSHDAIEEAVRLLVGGA
ncbi:MAG TPA: cation:proton antiporter [Gemmatimonadales bacterium]|nr:cation:proton antiporter [Gemmatimonadales bacterium]